MKVNREVFIENFFKIPEDERAPDSYLDRFSNPTAIFITKDGRDKISLLSLLIEMKLDYSNGELRRLIQQGGISVDTEEKTTDINQQIDIFAEDELIVSIGKKKKFIVYLFEEHK